MAGWTNLLGQIAGIASGSYSGAQITVDIIYLISGKEVGNNNFMKLLATQLNSISSITYAIVGPVGLMFLNGLILIIAGIVNTFAETLLTGICYVSAIWGSVGVFMIVIWMLCSADELQDASFVFGSKGYDNDTGQSPSFSLTPLAYTFIQLKS